MLDEALRAPDPAERFERLRVIGDGVLYGCGFFGDHFAARGVDAKYMCAIGTRAYGTASSMLRRHADEGGPDLFAELADNFHLFVDVVADVADATITMGIENSARARQSLRAMAPSRQRTPRRRADVEGHGADPRRQRDPVSEAKLAGNGAGLVRERALAARIQGGLERVYRLDRVADVGDFLRKAREGERESLLLRRAAATA